MNWDKVVERVAPHIVKIETPTASGTGFLFTYNQDKSFCGIATAYHVVDYAEDWQQPIKIHHIASNHSILLREAERTIIHDWKTDSAVIIFQKGDLVLPDEPIPLLPAEKSISIGCEVGWLGFPAIESWTLCFFSGNISARRDDRKAYLIDGVAINGVSGGPVIFSDVTDGAQIVGVMTAYRANRSGGDALPGLSFAQDVSHFHGVANHIKSVDEANKKKQELERSKAEDQTETKG